MIPGAMWLFFLTVVGAGTALLGPPVAWKGVDFNVQHRPGKPPVQEFRAWTAPRYMQQVKPGKTCKGTLFAMVTGAQHDWRAQVNGVEQVLDWSWSTTFEISEGYWPYEVIFVHPVTREEIIREGEFRCGDLEFLTWPISGTGSGLVRPAPAGGPPPMPDPEDEW